MLQVPFLSKRVTYNNYSSPVGSKLNMTIGCKFAVCGDT